MNSTELYALGKRYGACKEGLDSIKGQSAAEWWDNCDNCEWMLWLEGKAWSWKSGQEGTFRAKLAPIDADDEAKRAPIYADYKAKWALIYADYEAKLALIDADYEAKLALIDADYEAKLALIDADYWAKLALIDADYEAKRADVLREIVGNPFDEAVII